MYVFILYACVPMEIKYVLNKPFMPGISTGCYELKLSESRTCHRHPLGNCDLHDNLSLPGEPEACVRHHHPRRVHDGVGCVPEKDKCGLLCKVMSKM